MKKRTRKSRETSQDHANGSSRGASPKRTKLSPDVDSDAEDGAPIKVFIVQAKLSSKEISDLMVTIETTRKSSPPMFELCAGPNESDVILTAVRMKKRLERHVSWSVAKQKAIVIPEWIRDSVIQQHPLPCGDYAAIEQLRDETICNCPDNESCRECRTSKFFAQPLSPPATPSSSLTPIASSPPSGEAPAGEASLSYKSRYACQRASPLICVNQDLAKELDCLRRSRELEGLNMNARAYERAIAAIKAYPYVFDLDRLHNEVAGLSGIGKKVLFKIEEFITTGQISESREIQASTRFQSLVDFTSIYGIGPVKARELYDRGLRTIEHLEAYYDVDAPGLKDQTTAAGSARLSAKGAPEITIKVGLAMRHDLSLPIPRAEVEDMHSVVMKHLAWIQQGCISTIVGGYRRGKQESNDVDIVISHSDWRGGGDKVKGLCKRLVQRLYSEGLVTHVMHLSSFRPHNALRTGHWDSLEKSLTIFRMPSTNGHERVHRRLDLIFASPEAYWTAVMGWSGSKMFERDLRLWAKERMYVCFQMAPPTPARVTSCVCSNHSRGLKFDSTGMYAFDFDDFGNSDLTCLLSTHSTRRHDSKVFYPKSEEEAFNILGLDWVDPTLRNAGI